MRNLINLIESKMLTEATGLAGRSDGDIFKDQSGNSVIFRELNFYPPQGGKIPTEQLLHMVVSHAEQLQTQGVDVSEVNKSSGAGGFGLAKFQYPDGSIRAFIRYFKQINPVFRNNTWDNDKIPGLIYGSVSSEKMRVGYAPSDVLPSDTPMTPGEIVQKIVAKFGVDNPMAQVAQQLLAGPAGETIRVSAENINVPAFSDLFCEMLHPIALAVGWYTGDAGIAEEKFLPDGGFSGSRASFGSSKTEGLLDSMMVDTGSNSVKVSSKKSVGSAKAAASNLLKEFKKLENTNSADDKKILKKYQKTIGILHAITTQSGEHAPLSLGMEFKIIDQEEYRIILGLKDHNVSYIELNSEIEDSELTDNLKKMWYGRKTNKPESATAYYHLIAGVATLVAKHINDNTDFSKAAATILNNGALVQVYTKVSESKGMIELHKFKSVYPSTAVTGVVLDAGTRYKSGSVDGKFGFQILYNGGKPSVGNDQVDGQPPAALSTKPIAAPNAITGKNVELRPKRTAKAEKPAGDAGVGRERR
jgi:hypothetical protein